MLIYWVLFGFFAAGAILAQPRVAAGHPIPGHHLATAERGRMHIPLLLGTLLIITVIGLRYKVGADWFTYAQIFGDVQRFDLLGAIERGDPGYQLLNWVAFHLGSDVWLVNLMSAAIFGWGLYRFCSVQPSPWLAVAVAIPYMVIVVAMGYTRQSIALGVLMAGLAKQSRGASTLNFALYVALAATFHRTAVVLFPLVSLSGRGSRAINLLLVGFASILMYDFFLGDSMAGFVHNYIDADYSSQGALVRVSMNMVAAVLLWLFRGRLGFEEHEFKIWRNFSLASLLFLLMLAVLPSTAVDRMSLYMMPLQIAVLTRVALLGERRLIGTTAVLAYLMLVEFVWLNFADHARFWVPYQFYPF